MGINETDPEAYLAPQTGDVNIQGNKVLYFTLSSDFCSFDRVKECGFYYGQSPELNGAERVLVDASSGEFTETVLLKDYESDYYVCSFISNGVDELCSDVGKISIGPLSDYVYFASLATDSYVSSTKKATVSVDFDIVAGVEVTSAGICYGITKNLSIDGTFVEASRIGDDFMSGELEGLEAGKQYYARPYIKDGNDIAYAEVSSFSVYAIPEVKTVDVKKITDKSAHLYGNVLADCGKEILERGFVWTEGDTNPTISSDRKEVSGKVGEYDAKIEGLKPNTLYSFRAYAKNSEGISLGNVSNFTTSVGLPSIVIGNISNLTSSSAIVSCYVNGDGGDTISEFGVLVDTSVDVNPENARKFTSSDPSSLFSVTIEGLSRKTNYYAQAYVTNSAGTSYSEVVEFETLADLPIVRTLAVNDINYASVTTGGIITDDGGGEITERGVIWGKNEQLNIVDNNKTKDGIGVGEFTSLISEFSFGTKYFVCAYAINSAGISYGEVMNFTTPELDLGTANNLSNMGTANSYIVSDSGIYKIKAVKGNSYVSVGDVSSVDVLWESFGTNEVPKVCDLINWAHYNDGSIVFSINSKYREGNAVIAARNRSGEILWSWHIWLTDQPQEQKYNVGTIMMDRNLGATSATPGEIETFGLFYQWGRKDPFLGSSNHDTLVIAESTAVWPDWSNGYYSVGAGQTPSLEKSIEYSILNPMTLIQGQYPMNDWCYTSTADNTRWGEDKTIYDPCPHGWRVPSVVSISSQYWVNGVKTEFGINFSSTLGNDSVIWYPCAGHLANYNPSPGVGYMGYYWTVIPHQVYRPGDSSFCIEVTKSTERMESGWGLRDSAYSIRCVKE